MDSFRMPELRVKKKRYQSNFSKNETRVVCVCIRVKDEGGVIGWVAKDKPSVGKKK